MKRKKIDVLNEKKIITAMVVSEEFLSQITSMIDVDLIQAKHFQQIAKWCLSYYEQYNDAPKENIESIYHAWTAKGKAADEVVDAVHDVLENISEQYEEEPNLNVPYLLDVAADYFSTRRIEALKDELEYSLTEGNKDAATAAIADFGEITTGFDLGIDPLNDETAWDAAFAESQKPLIDWKSKSANYFFSHALCRDGLIGILAPEKRGKTWWCLELAIKAVSQRKRVALFEVGDMSQSQIMKRLGVRLSCRPAFRSDLGVIDVPKKIWREDDEIFIENKEVECDRISNASTSKKAVQKFLRGHGIRPDDSYFKISVQPNSSANVNDIAIIIKKWERYDGFIPDIIIIDYADILAPEPGTGSLSTRDQANATWKALRRLSQERHCLVIAPTQADAASYSQETLDAQNFSEDKRKLGHVTGMLGLNQTREEKARGIMRLNWIVLREGDFQVDKCLYVGQCFKLGKAFCCAALENRKIKPKKLK